MNYLPSKPNVCYFQVNGQLITENIRKHVSRLERVGFVSPAGIEIGVFPFSVSLGQNGVELQMFNYEKYVRHQNNKYK